MPERGRRVAERVWYGGDRASAVMRALLSPAERVFGGLVGARDILYDAGWLATHETAIPAVSIGNLTVGGTGKTPIAAWVARGLEARGAHPAIVLRGYGDDEPKVHETLNPSIPVVVNPDRIAATKEAARRGADVAVLDDAFQHRRARRVADLVLVSADRWSSDIHLLPAGPWREPLRAARRATLLVVTRKAAPAAQVDAVHQALAAAAPGVPRVSVHLAPFELVRATGDRTAEPIESLRGQTIRAILSIADPGAFIRQLEAAGAHVLPSIFPDHHAFSDEEIRALTAGLSPREFMVCTLKDAVKLAPRWPRLAPPLWYVSQQVMVERGVGGIEHVLDELVRGRSQTSFTAG